MFWRHISLVTTITLFSTYVKGGSKTVQYHAVQYRNAKQIFYILMTYIIMNITMPDNICIYHHSYCYSYPVISASALLLCIITLYLTCSTNQKLQRTSQNKCWTPFLYALKKGNKNRCICIPILYSCSQHTLEPPESHDTNVQTCVCKCSATFRSSCSVIILKITSYHHYWNQKTSSSWPNRVLFSTINEIAPKCRSKQVIDIVKGNKMRRKSVRKSTLHSCASYTWIVFAPLYLVQNIRSLFIFNY